MLSYMLVSPNNRTLSFDYVTRIPVRAWSDNRDDALCFANRDEAEREAQRYREQGALVYVWTRLAE